MGIMRKVLTGIGCAGSVAGGIVAGKIVGAKVYEYTGNTAVSGLAGGGAGATIGLAGVGATLAISQASHDAACWKNHCMVEDEDAKNDDKMLMDEIADLNDLLGKYYANEIKLKHEIYELEEENARLKEREARRHERLRQTAQKDSEDNQDEGNCFDVFKEEDKK